MVAGLVASLGCAFLEWGPTFSLTRPYVAVMSSCPLQAVNTNYPARISPRHVQVVMERLLASRDSRRRRRGGTEDADYEEDEQEDLRPMAYRDAWTQARDWGDSEQASRPASGSSPTSSMSEYDYDYDERNEDGDPQYEGWGSSGFSSAQSRVSVGSDGESGRSQQWERVSGIPRPRRRPAARRFEEDQDSYGDRRMREASRCRSDRREDGSEWGGARDVGRSSMASGRERDSS